MFSMLIWCIYGIIVGSIAKSIVPGEENFGFIKTVLLGVTGSYVGGSVLYLLGNRDAVSPAGIVIGIAGAVLALVVYNKLTANKTS
jgi:uncharacterized membrane protein YeaQ/YmgE (transglycosylase-associated protein family)